MKILTLFVVLFVLSNCTSETNQETENISDGINENFVEEWSEVEVLETDALVEEEVVVEEGSTCRTNFDVYVNDPGEDYTNVRDAPSGNVVIELSHQGYEDGYMFTVVEVKDGWYKFESPIESVAEDIEVPGGFGWVHKSVVATDTRNYGGQIITLFESADESSTVTGTIEDEVGGLKVLDACDDWVLIELKYDDYYRKGWMKTEWCCGNPFTNCS